MVRVGGGGWCWKELGCVQREARFCGSLYMRVGIGPRAGYPLL
jgi:hypothetical protein